MNPVYLRAPMQEIVVHPLRSGTTRKQPRRGFYAGTGFWGGVVLMPVVFALVLASEAFAPAPLPAYTAPLVAADSTATVMLSFAGDLMCHVPQLNNAKQADGSYDFNPSFKEITPYLSEADVTFANLETTFAGPKKAYGGYPAFNTPDAYLDALKNSGIDFLVTSNNHSMDTGEDGLLRTITQVKQRGFAYTGTHESQADRDSIRVVNVKGITIAVLNYTYGTNGAYPAASRKWMLNVADSALVRGDVLRARNMADLVLVFYHWGLENKQEPDAKQDSMFHWAADAGADLVIGAHPHVLQPVGYFKTAVNARLDTGVVAWSLGNFLSNQYWRYTDAGVIFNITLKKDFATGTVSVAQTSYVPTWVYRSYDPALKQHVVLPAAWCGREALPAWISAESKKKMCEAFDDTNRAMTKYSSKPVVHTLK